MIARWENGYYQKSVEIKKEADDNVKSNEEGLFQDMVALNLLLRKIQSIGLVANDVLSNVTLPMLKILNWALGGGQAVSSNNVIKLWLGRQTK